MPWDGPGVPLQWGGACIQLASAFLGLDWVLLGALVMTQL